MSLDLLAASSAKTPPVNFPALPSNNGLISWLVHGSVSAALVRLTLPPISWVALAPCVALPMLMLLVDFGSQIETATSTA